MNERVRTGRRVPGPSSEAFREQALHVHRDFLAEGSFCDPSAYVDPDPASTVGPSNPVTDTVTQRARELGGFAGLVVDGSVFRVGFTRDAPSKLQRLLTEYPDADLRLFPACYDEAELCRVQDQINELMCADTDMSILSCGVEVARNVVTVGVSDINSRRAAALRARFGDAVEVFAAEPIELLSSRTTAEPPRAPLR